MMSFLEAQNSTTGPQLTVSKNAKKLWNTYCVHTKTFSKKDSALIQNAISNENYTILPQ